MEKPKFTHNQRVAFDFGNGISGIGWIKGLAFEHIIDGWIVQIEEIAYPTGTPPYPWSCVVVNHPMLKPIP